MLEVACEEQTVWWTQIYDCFSKFKIHVTWVENDECSVCPSVSKTFKIVDLMKEYVLENRRIIIHKVATVLGILFGSV
jgi:hypothetical protein